MTDRLGHKPSELSGGQQQRVAVARALVSRPAVLFADEPTGNLDSHTGDEVLQLLRRSVDDLGQTIIMVTHDAHAAAVADRVLFLQDGEIVQDRGRMTPHPGEIYDVIDMSLRGAAMTRLALRSLLSHPLRTALTTLAILLGVAMISGTYVLTDQISNAFDGIFSTAYEGTAVVVTPKNAVGGFDDESTVLTMPDSLLAQARAVDGVAAAAGGAEAMGAVVVDGALVKTSGSPTLIMSTEDAAWSNVGWTAGAAPARAGEVVVDAGFAEKHDVSVGDEIGLATLHGTVPATVSGIFTFGDSSSLGRHHHGRRPPRRRAALVRHARRAHLDQPHGGAG